MDSAESFVYGKLGAFDQFSRQLTSAREDRGVVSSYQSVSNTRKKTTMSDSSGAGSPREWEGNSTRQLFIATRPLSQRVQLCADQC